MTYDLASRSGARHRLAIACVLAATVLVVLDTAIASAVRTMAMS